MFGMNSFHDFAHFAGLPGWPAFAGHDTPDFACNWQAKPGVPFSEAYCAGAAVVSGASVGAVPDGAGAAEPAVSVVEAVDAVSADGAVEAEGAWSATLDAGAEATGAVASLAGGGGAAGSVPPSSASALYCACARSAASDSVTCFCSSGVDGGVGFAGMLERSGVCALSAVRAASGAALH